jgi:capsular polysaccharide transport system ATP-binding protein
MAEIKQWCDKVILVNSGMTTVYDDVDEGIEMYKRICN